MKIRKGSFEEVKPFRGRAAKDHVSMDNPPEAEWWVAEQEGGAIVGFVCGVRKGSSVRFKSAWVEPKYRGVGIYDMLMNARWKYYLSSKGVKKITAYCTPMSIQQYQKYGFVAKRKNAHGNMYMVRDL